jgi:hypothetical protein
MDFFRGSPTLSASIEKRPNKQDASHNNYTQYCKKNTITYYNASTGTILYLRVYDLTK